MRKQLEWFRKVTMAMDERKNCDLDLSYIEEVKLMERKK